MLPSYIIVFIVIGTVIGFIFCCRLVFAIESGCCCLDVLSKGSWSDIITKLKSLIKWDAETEHAVMICLATADFISDCLFLAYLKYKMGKLESGSQFYQLNYNCYIAGIFFLLLSITANCGFALEGFKFITHRGFENGFSEFAPWLLGTPFIPLIYSIVFFNSIFVETMGSMGLPFPVIECGWKSTWLSSERSRVIRALIGPILGIPHYFTCVAVNSMFVIFLGLINVCFLFSTLSNAELVYKYHIAQRLTEEKEGNQRKQFYYRCTVSGVVLEDIPQFIIQVSYASRASVLFRQSLSPVQWISFAFTFWRIWIACALKWMGQQDEAPAVAALAKTTDSVKKTSNQNPIADNPGGSAVAKVEKNVISKL
jgi:hypothetical protein